MDYATFLAFAVFVIVMTGTPGPGNLTFLAIGASAGYRTAFPVIVASQIGSLPLKLSVAYGLGHVMAGGGTVVTVFKVLSMAYMTYLAWRIVCLSVKPKGEVALPSFWEGLLIHPLSPKTWAMNLVAFSPTGHRGDRGRVKVRQRVNSTAAGPSVPFANAPRTTFHAGWGQARYPGAARPADEPHSHACGHGLPSLRTENR